MDETATTTLAESDKPPDLKAKSNEEILAVNEDDKKKHQAFRKDKAVRYSATVGDYCEWNRRVNLEPPNNVEPLPDDHNIYNYYDSLQYMLYETGYPETIDRTTQARRRAPKFLSSIAILSSPVECMAIIAAGSVHAPGCMHLILSPTWLSKHTSEHDPNLMCLYMHKSICFESGGRSYIDVFDPPRRVTYFVNYFTRACTDGQRRDGEQLEVALDCPMSSSIPLCAIADDKVLTRCLMAEAGVLYPETLAFVYNPARPYPVPKGADITVITLTTKNGVENLMLEEINRFLKRNKDTYSKVVVKPSGPLFHASVGVTIHDISDAIVIWTSALKLLAQLESGDNILVEIFYAPRVSKDEQGEELSFRLRSTVCRGRGDVPICTTLVCGVNRADKPINGDNTMVQSLDTTLLQFGMGSERKRLNERVCLDSAKVLQQMMLYEKKFSAAERGGVGAQTDLIGIDFVLGERDGTLNPVGIEVNSHDCTINCSMYEVTNPELKGTSIKPLVETMIERSQCYLVKNKWIMVLGSGGISKRFIWITAKQHNINIILVDGADVDPLAKSMTKNFLQYDYDDHTQDEYHAERICELVKNSGWKIDGCCTFCEDNGPLAARICDLMKLTSQGLQGALNTKKKTLTQQCLRRRKGTMYCINRTYLYSCDTMLINSASDIANAVAVIGLPCMLKLEYGTSGVGVRLVHNKGEAIEQYNHIIGVIEKNNQDFGLGHGKELMIMEYIGGTEHIIDVILFNRRLIATFVRDSGPNKPGTFNDTAACMPSCLPEDKVGQLITAAYQCCTEIGLVNGVFNVEMKMTQTGPKLVEINACMGGFYLRDWVKTCYDVDLVLCNFLIACGIKPLVPHTEPRCQLMGVMCFASIHSGLWDNPKNKAILNTLVNQRLVMYTVLKETLEISSDPDFDLPFCSLAVKAENVEKAKSALLEMCKVLNISTPEFKVAEFLRDFTDHIPLPLLVK